MTTKAKISIISGAALLVLTMAMPVLASPTDFSRSPAGYYLNDNGYLTYYSVAFWASADCRAHLTTRCRQRLQKDSAFCRDWAASGKCGQDAATLPR